MKRTFPLVASIIVVALVSACATGPKPIKVDTKSPPYDIIQHSGSTLGITELPGWVAVALQGPKAVEKLPDYKNDYVVVVDTVGKDLEGTKMAASLLNAQTEVSRYLSTRVKETFAGAQVGDKDKIETYMERVVKSVSEVQFSGFQKAAEWWVEYRWYKDAFKWSVDRDEYRVFQLYTIDKQLLQTQLQKILDDASKAEPQMTADKQKAIDLVNQSLQGDF